VIVIMIIVHHRFINGFVTIAVVDTRRWQRGTIRQTIRIAVRIGHRASASPGM